MPSLCCFWNPKREYVRDRTLHDVCADCGRTYGHPLEHPPEKVGEYTIVDVIDRGFYGAIYVAESGMLKQRSVLKVVPRGVYEAFGKDFDEECRVHADVAAGTQHLVKIRDAFDADVRFAGEAEDLPCHVAVLEYVEGEKLDRFVADQSRLTATAIAQIAIDLFRLLQELENKQRFHNDLHAGNLLVRKLPSEQRRAEAVDPGILAVAVDLGSITDASRSDEEQQTGDLHQVAHHLLTLADRLLAQPDQGSDVEYRLATALQEIAHMLAPESVKQRPPRFGDLIDLIYAAFDVASSPWKEPPGGLRAFDESYNAQTLRAWFVPRLLVDPGGWQAQLEVAGPLVITGMRGCGKTILLRSLQFHSRGSRAVQLEAEEAESAAEILAADGYVGLYVSCTRLLDRLGSPSAELHEPYARLFLVYAREALRALRHLREIKAPAPLVTPGAHRAIAEAVAAYVEGAALDGIDSELMLERRLQRMQISLERGESAHRLLAHPTVAFPHLAEAVLSCSPLWASSRVYFLLDDVSTRHLHEEAIRDLISTLMFNHERCAFKVTTEAQTLELVLKSPGLVEEARIGRDYETFDLGAKINERLHQDAGRAGKEFIAEVLRARARQFPRHPDVDPSAIVGDVTLEEIARTIVSTSKTAPEKKAVYHGLSALTALCVGDIGDVISIYEMIISRAGRVGVLPVDATLQSTCFQEYCSRRLYHLSRRKGELKDFALGFAEAAHELLLNSASGVEGSGRRPRLRQYSSLYVRVTSGDEGAQLERLRELMDAGVFVLAAGPDAPRTKTRDSNPITQFVLTYRKLFGLSNFIGLSLRDRFELSGPELEEWLAHPERTREILVRNLTGSGARGPSKTDADVEEMQDDELDESEETTSEADVTGLGKVLTSTHQQPTLFEFGEDEAEIPEELGKFAAERMPRLQELEPEELGALGIEGVILGRGFEERTLASAKRLTERLEPAEAVLISYPLEGYGATVEEVVRTGARDVRVVEYSDAIRDGVPAPKGLTVVDVTGLAKPMIFGSVRELLQRDGRVVVAHTGAEVHYPLNRDIARVLDAQEKGDSYALLDALSDVLTGEQRPYTFEKLLSTDADGGRRRLLCAAASPKHERLMSLIEERDYDRVDIVVPASDTPRSRLARLAAEVASKNFHSSSVAEVPSDDLAGMLSFIATHYQRFYTHGNFDFELGLTGSKLHAVACAAASSALRFSQCWYVRPAGFDTDRFTQGVGTSRYFLLEAVRLDPGPMDGPLTAAASTPAGV
jgi:ABC1 atypical kinase-like domain